MAHVTLQDLLRAYLRQRIGESAKKAFAERVGIAVPDVINASNNKGNVSLGMFEKLVDGQDRPLSSVLFDVARLAAEMEAAPDRPMSRSGTPRPVRPH